MFNRWIRTFSLWFFIIQFIPGCALHMPISEEIIFSQEAEAENSYSERPLFRYRGLGSSFSGSFYTSEFEKKNFSAYGDEFDTDLNPNWKYGFAAYGFTIGVGDNLSFGISPGAILYGSGVDGTLRLTDTFFITVTTNIYRNAEIILQKRIRPNLSVGLFYRHEKQEFGMHETLRRDKLVPANLLGFRGLFNLNKGRFSLRGFTSLGMETGTFTPVLLAGLALTITRERQSKWPPNIQY